MRRGQAWPGGGKNEFWILKNKKMRCRSWRLRRPLLLISRLLFSGIPFRKLYKVEEEVRVSVKVMTLAVTLLYFSSTSDPNFPSYISVLLLLLFLFFQLGKLFLKCPHFVHYSNLAFGAGVVFPEKKNIRQNYSLQNTSVSNVGLKSMSVIKAM